MNILEQNKEKINGILETFDRMIINGYILQLCNYRQFLFYLIQNNIKLKDFDKAQELANNILNQKISDSFDGLINQINNLLPNINKIFSASYYWCINQCEFATDINFKSRQISIDM